MLFPNLTYSVGGVTLAAATSGSSMTFSQHLVLWLHLVFVVFALGPIALAIMSTPRYIRHRDIKVLRYLSRITLIFTIISVGVLIAGMALAQMLSEAAKPWVIVSATLYVVSLLLLALVIRGQRRAIRALEADEEEAGSDWAAPEQGTASDPTPADSTPDSPTSGGQATADSHVASVERGQIAMLAGLTTVIWLVILGLMVWGGS